MPSTTRSASSTTADRRLGRRDPHAHHTFECTFAGQLPQPPERVHVGGVVAAVQSASASPRPSSTAATAVPLSTDAVGLISSTLRPAVRVQPGSVRSLRHGLQRRAGRILVGGAAVVEGPDRVLVLERDPELLQLRREVLGRELADVLGERLDLRVEHGVLGTGLQPLEPVVADVEEAVHADHLARLGRAPARYAGDEPVPGRKLLQQALARGGTVASSERSTIGASVPSMSQRMAERCGRSRRGASRRSAVAVPGSGVMPL